MQAACAPVCFALERLPVSPAAWVVTRLQFVSVCHLSCLIPISVGVAGLGNLLGRWPQVHAVNLERPSALLVCNNVAGGAECDS